MNRRENGSWGNNSKNGSPGLRDKPDGIVFEKKKGGGRKQIIAIYISALKVMPVFSVGWLLC